ncbi:MAG: trehalose-6-phosphate synthase [Planctomycetota bacterium]
MPADPAGRLIVVANRLPVRRVDTGGKDGQGWKVSPGGLVSALKPILQEREGTWVGWAGETGPAPRPFKLDGIRNRPVPLDEVEFEAFYEGFSNRTLWPLYHDCVRPPEFHRHWWRPYVEINKRFAKAAASQAKPGDTIWVHDYQLQLVPEMIRKLRPDCRIGFFLHIPFPPEELFAQMPWRREILRGLLGADLVGFQTASGAQNFARAARMLADAKGRDRDLQVDEHVCRARCFPISVDTPFFDKMAREPEVIAKADELRTVLGDRKIILGVDRLDYTKGIDIRLRAFEEILSSGKATSDDVVFVQVAVPSRAGVEEYATERANIEQIVGRINGQHASPGWVAVHYLYRGLPIRELISFYLAADILMVTPLRDGMNLVCKEYCACRLESDGVLVLSEFAGAAAELRGAILVNPHDVDGMAGALTEALDMTSNEARKRMATLRKIVTRHDVFRWADAFLSDLAGQPMLA